MQGSSLTAGYANVVAVCDVDLDSQSSQGTISLVPKAKQFRDWRVMFDQMAGDMTPYSSYSRLCTFPVAMAAMELGKGVYVEKPMCRTFLEAELMARMAERNPKIATQVGNQDIRVRIIPVQKHGKRQE